MQNNCTTFTYNNNTYIIDKNKSDLSTDGCIFEIVTRNDYLLDKYVDIENANFIDIGANCGLASLILGKQNPKSKIYSFEPDIQVFNVFKKNVELNNLSNIILSNKAVSKEGIKEITLYKSPLCSGGNTTCSTYNDIQNHFHNFKIESYTVKSISLDEIIKENNINEIELLKIDCEGAEYEILYNSEIFQKGIVKNMVGEFHNLCYNTTVKDTSGELIKYCKKYVKGILKIEELTI